MKYWRGYLAAIIFAAIGWGFVQFAQAHPVLVDMVYPYLTRIYMSSVAQWASGTAACIWQLLLFLAIAGIIASAVLMVVLKWNPVQWLGWVLAVAFGINMLSTVAYGLNAYASPLADDIRLEIYDYSTSELNAATMYFRDQANALSGTVPRTPLGEVDYESFETLAAAGYQGFDALTYEKGMSVFASNKAPVKKLTLPGLFTPKGASGATVALTGEAAVDPNVPAACLPFAICKELSHRISIYTEADANFAAFLACIHHPDAIYRYSGYLMAYYYCHQAMCSIPTSTAQAAASNLNKGLNNITKADMERLLDFYGEAEISANVQTSANITASDSEVSLITFSSYTDVADLFASWYIQEFILPAYEEENTEPEFDPYDAEVVFAEPTTEPTTEAAP